MQGNCQELQRSGNAQNRVAKVMRGDEPNSEEMELHGNEWLRNSNEKRGDGGARNGQAEHGVSKLF